MIQVTKNTQKAIGEIAFFLGINQKINKHQKISYKISPE
jgi:hypothetical protein